MKTRSNRLKIVGSNSVSFDNAHHMRYHRALYDRVVAVDKQKLHVTDEMLTTWQACIAVEIEINKQMMASVHTQRLVEKDRERDNVLSFIIGTINVNRHATAKSVCEAARVLSLILKPYRGIQEDGFEAETAHIIGLLHDLEKQPAEITLLGLDDAINQLRTLNTEYEKMSDQRDTDKSETKIPSAKEARPKTDAAWDIIADLIYASYQLAANDADRELIAKLINGINQTSDHFKEIHNMTMAQRAAAKDKKNGGGKDKKPSDGDKKPGDGKDKKPSDGDKKPDDGGKKPDDGGGKKPDDGGGKKPSGGDDGKKPGGGAGPVPSDPLPMVPKE